MAHARPQKRPVDVDYRGLVWQVLSDVINGRLVRCDKCRELLPEREVVILTCPRCVFYTARCIPCGGQKGVIRSLMAHHRAYAWDTMRKLHGDDHYDLLRDETSPVQAKTRLKLLRGR